jgi:hypothetical protein
MRFEIEIGHEAASSRAVRPDPTPGGLLADAEFVARASFALTRLQTGALPSDHRLMDDAHAFGPDFDYCVRCRRPAPEFEPTDIIRDWVVVDDAHGRVMGWICAGAPRRTVPARLSVVSAAYH